ncbi:Do family serine endopeptidase [Aestuariispira ectoiniformans]|uniref:Do family serine endopeptidase n=1 Tax=Aestuariispira ectoiniformans TaxID=2775080 RepID=UPI00223C4ADA|nr:Do family serine endopeptidase [Aestuariispira ectoiniformans]
MSRQAKSLVQARSAYFLWGHKPATILSIIVLAALMIASSAWQAQARAVPDSFADMAEKLLPSVVDIRAIQNGQTVSDNGDQQPDMQSPFPPGSPFGDLFERFRRNNPEHQGPRRREAAGSGFIIEDNMVVTNNHVVEGADEIYVVFRDDSRQYEAEVVGRDEGVDLALLKVKTDHKMPAVKFGNSDKARIGDWVMAIGNPWGLGGSVTAGIISARGRDIDRESFTDFIQTDAPINMGNSGGPLFNMDGDVIGINTAIFSRSGGSIGLGFAIPSNQAKHVVQQLREYGHTRRGWLGVSIQSVTPDIAESMGLDKPEGALVSTVYEKSPAAAGGVEAGDVIIRFNDRVVEDSTKLRRMVAATDVGRDVPVVVWRDGEKVDLSVELGEREKVDIASLGGSDKSPGQSGGAKSEALDQLGVDVSPITPALRRQYNLSDSQKGVVITAVRPGSSADEKRLAPGMVIVGDNRGPINSVDELRQRVESAHDDGRRSVLLHVAVEGDLRFVAIRFKAEG